ncbi:PAS domain-containing sensor histidine kinase [Actinosynnema pretiosum subsp. pretiosum]|uniref:histidine kinase n=2 Tax=Actinosynnema TaxID=40566 RepID=C6WJM7_ACTMD|nr:PAS domain-containing sensor histidine kinase [Actinosynnema mirum]ACU36252.1 PAS/PAC sensor signal transduction histidine kinase [Actinosynnema mirum DSM 43827]AXX29704.1 Putative SigmaB asociated two-component system sensor protein [Actinosynnema pretiosum subsp. pretiosum]QUF06073.1 PAS domain-containing sensor histidine kinase [Actinosynnema pretiosum subsp. pretiosum]
MDHASAALTPVLRDLFGVAADLATHSTGASEARARVVELCGLLPDGNNVLKQALGLLDALRVEQAREPRHAAGAPAPERSLVVLVDAHGATDFDPDAVRDLLGMVEGPPTMERFTALVHPDDLPRARGEYRRLLTSPHRQVELDLRVRHAAGHWVVLAVGMLNLLDTGAGVVVAHCRDVTARRVAEEEARAERGRLQQVVLRLAGAVAVDDRERVFLHNPAFTAVFGDRPWNGMPVADFTAALGAVSAEPVATAARLAELASSEWGHRDVRLVLRDGRIVVGDLVPLGPAAELGRFWHFRDVTADTAARVELEESNRVLAEAAAVKGRFVATVSHELRTPLTAVLAFAEMMPGAGPLNAEHLAHLEVIRRNTARLVRLVDDLLLLSRLESHRLPLSLAEVDVAGLLAEAEHDHANPAESAGIELVVEPVDGPKVRGDAVRLSQVLDNVIGNALKFTPAGGRVRVRSQVDPTGWLITVSDTGIGIPAADLPDLFDVFRRAGNSTGVPGSGLGLSICRQIMALHGGNIRVRAAEGRGTTVELTLPIGGSPG